jgi:hypothetical protein
MNIVKGRAFYNKDEALKGLWSSVEALLKSVKSLMSTAGAGSTRKIQTAQIERCLNGIRIIEEGFPFVEGTLVKLGKDDGDYLVARYEGFREGRDTDPINVGFTTIAGTEKYRWTQVDDFMELPVGNVSDSTMLFSLTDLPTLVGSKFMGKLFDELMKEIPK